MQGHTAAGVVIQVAGEDLVLGPALLGAEFEGHNAELLAFDQACAGVDAEYPAGVLAELLLGGSITAVDDLHSLVHRIGYRAGCEEGLVVGRKLHNRNEGRCSNRK